MNCKNLRIVKYLVILNLVLLILTGFMYYGTGSLLKQVENQVDIYGINTQTNLTEIYNKVIDIAIDNINRDALILDIIKIINSKLENVKKENEKLKKDITYYQGLDVKDIEKIKQANLYILNDTVGISGSGTHIKIKGKSYILTCAHLFEEVTDTMYAIEDNGHWTGVKILAYNKKIDLALLTVDNLIQQSYLEIADKAPKEGSKVMVIGNPAGLLDVVTDGIVAKRNDIHYLITNTTYFGNSGGALLYDGKIVGVMSQLVTYFNFPCFVNYGLSVNLEQIHEFLEGIE